MRHMRGLTLPELLITTSISAIIFVVVCVTTVQVGKIYTRTSARFSPQTAEQLAFRRMQYDMRDPMSVSWAPSNTTRVDIVRPCKETDPTKATGFNQVSYSASAAGNLTLAPGKTVRYFLGSKQPTPTDDKQENWTEARIDSAGTTIFRVESLENNQPISPANGPYPRASVKVIIDGVTVNPPNPNMPGSTTPEPIFYYDEMKQMLKLAITIGIPDKTRGGWPIIQQTLRTEYYFRNVVR